MRFLLLFLLLICATPVSAQETKNAEVPFREDAGLIDAEYYLATGKYSQALSAVGGVLQRHPNNADAYTYRAIAYQHLGDLKKSRDDYARALELNPRHLGALKYTGSLFVQKKKLDQAMEILAAIREVCLGTPCAEADELENEINAIRKKKD